ncbi:unnamed protein product [Boreogadus saida]
MLSTEGCFLNGQLDEMFQMLGCVVCGSAEMSGSRGGGGPSPGGDASLQHKNRWLPELHHTDGEPALPAAEQTGSDPSDPDRFRAFRPGGVSVLWCSGRTTPRWDRR